jgi:hypothetical protein
MEDFIAFTVLWVFGLAIVLSILKAIWVNIGCIFIGVVVLLISAIMFFSLGLHF